jgi:hypothetical protein
MEPDGTGWTALVVKGRVMTSTPPEPPVWPAFPDYQPPAFSPPPVSPPPPPDLPRRRRMSVYRIVSGILWGAVALICAAGAVGEWLIGIPGGAILCVVIALGSGWYDYRVWTYRTRRLIV